MSFRDKLRERSLSVLTTSDGARWQVRTLDGRMLVPHGGAKALVALQTAASALQTIRAENLGVDEADLQPGKEEILQLLQRDPEMAFEVLNMADAFICAGVVAASQPIDFEECSACAGDGTVLGDERDKDGHQKPVVCDACRGQGRIPTEWDEFEPLRFVTAIADARPDADVFHIGALPEQVRIELGPSIKEASSRGLDIAGFRQGAGSVDPDAQSSPKLREVAQ